MDDLFDAIVFDFVQNGGQYGHHTIFECIVCICLSDSSIYNRAEVRSQLKLQSSRNLRLLASASRLGSRYQFCALTQIT